jgi:putative two-component system response regulator
LVVEDHQSTREMLARILGREGYRCDLVRDIAEARGRLDGAPYDLVICDVRLPDGSGVDLMAAVMSRHASIAVLMISTLDDADLAEQALELGAYGYIVKPVSANDVLIPVWGALRHRRGESNGHDESPAVQAEIIQRLCIAVEARDAEAAPRISQMSSYCWHIGRELGLWPEECERLHAASPMHDIGNVAVPDRILLKRGTLTAPERAAMQRHADTGYRILAGSRARVLRLASTIALTHHERYDGSGYPRGLIRDEIPLAGRIAAVADVFAALTRDRAHRPRLLHSDALKVLKEGRGADFDPDVLDAFLAVDERLVAESAAPELGLPAAGGESSGGLPAPAPLSPREREILQLAADGLAAREIAEELVVSTGTVKTHFQRIYAKLEAHDRAAAVATGLRRGLIR